MKHINRKEFLEHKILLPSLQEQRRIAMILDKADAMRRKRKRTLNLLDSLAPSLFLEMFGDPLTSSDWTFEALGQALLQVDSGWSPTCLDRPASVSEAGILKLSAITNSEYLEEQNKALPSQLSPKPAVEVCDGDILFCRKNTKELVGASTYVWQTRPQLYMSDLIFRLVPDLKKANSIFLQAQLSLPSQRRKISDISGGAAGSMPNVSKAKLRELPVMLPPLQLQEKFARTVRSNRALRVNCSRSWKDANLLFSSLQSRAFSGQL
jgi:type I restriction enzyme S subunit